MPRQGRDLEKLTHALERYIAEKGASVESPGFVEDRVTGQKREVDVLVICICSLGNWEIGKLGNDHCLLIFDNKKKYLGYYNTGIYAPAGYDLSKQILWLISRKKRERFQMRLGNGGPWKTMGFVESHTPSFSIGKKFSFNETKSYLEQSTLTDMRQWLYLDGNVKAEISFRGKLVDATDEWCFLQQQDGTVFYVARDNLSREDGKFIRTTLKNIEK